ncbi:hypothetical protein MRB53_005591 [Persea americana]|uniref:Uncharacterized protein n=1 Tax=Persea americana TaxID=3435 RepID=A0ACC2MEM1_PERAE|nr:hypothetical protein MRB53_005591 [Persea americana]
MRSQASPERTTAAPPSRSIIISGTLIFSIQNPLRPSSSIRNHHLTALLLHHTPSSSAPITLQPRPSLPFSPSFSISVHTPDLTQNSSHPSQNSRRTQHSSLPEPHAQNSSLLFIVFFSLTHAPPSQHLSDLSRLPAPSETIIIITHLLHHATHLISQTQNSHHPSSSIALHPLLPSLPALTIFPIPGHSHPSLPLTLSPLLQTKPPSPSPSRSSTSARTTHLRAAPPRRHPLLHLPPQHHRTHAAAPRTAGLPAARSKQLRGNLQASQTMVEVHFIPRQA